MPPCPILLNQIRPHVVYDQVKKLGREGILEEIGPGRPHAAKSAIPEPRRVRRGDSDEGASAENLQRRGLGWTAAEKDGKIKSARVGEVIEKRRVAGRRVMAEQEKHRGRVGTLRVEQNTGQRATIGTGMARVGTHAGERENATATKGEGGRDQWVPGRSRLIRNRGRRNQEGRVWRSRVSAWARRLEAAEIDVTELFDWREWGGWRRGPGWNAMHCTVPKMLLPAVLCYARPLVK